MDKRKEAVSVGREKQMSFITGLLKQVKLVWLLLSDSRISMWVKSVLPLSMLYVISPLDFVPDVLLGLGQLDDLGVLLLGMTLFVKLCPPDLVDYYTRQLEYGNDFYNDDDTVDTTYRVINED